MRERTAIRICTGAMSLSACALFAAGCVMQRTYDAAVQEGMTIRAELSQARGEERRLAREVSDMEQLNAGAVREAEAAAEALRQAKDEAEQGRQRIEQQIVKLQQRAAQATKQHRSLEYELTVAKENRAALQELVDVYQKKVRDGAAVPVASSTSEPTIHKPFDPSTIPVPQDLPAAPAVAQPTPAPTPVPAPAPVATGSHSRAVPPPHDDDWLTSVKNWLMSLWHSVFS